jgi:hypothetical protein
MLSNQRFPDCKETIGRPVKRRYNQRPSIVADKNHHILVLTFAGKDFQTYTPRSDLAKIFF